MGKVTIELITAIIALIASIIGLFISFKSIVNTNELKQNILSLDSRINNNQNVVVTIQGQVNDITKKVEEVARDTTVAFNINGEIKHIIKDVPQTDYAHYFDGSRIVPSSTNALYEFKLRDIQFPQGKHIKKFRVMYSWQYNADSNYDPAVLKFRLTFPPTTNTNLRTEDVASKSYTDPLKQWINEDFEISVPPGVPPETFNIYAAQSGDFEIMIKDMQVQAIFGI